MKDLFKTYQTFIKVSYALILCNKLNKVYEVLPYEDLKYFSDKIAISDKTQLR